MSWQAYVDNNLVGTKKIQAAAIYGLNGGAWAASAGFKPTDAEIKKVIGAFSNPSEIIASGIHLAGTKYLSLRYDDRSIYGKKGSSGCVCVKTKQAVLIAIYPENVQPGDATSVVEKLADYLISVNY